jgi:hypothetical protein
LLFANQLGATSQQYGDGRFHRARLQFTLGGEFFQTGEEKVEVVHIAHGGLAGVQLLTLSGADRRQKRVEQLDDIPCFFVGDAQAMQRRRVRQGGAMAGHDFREGRPEDATGGGPVPGFVGRG